MLTVILSITISSFAVFGLFCSLSLVMGLRVKEKYKIAVNARLDEFCTHMSVQRAETVFDGNRHIKSPPVILAKNEIEAEALKTLSLEYGYEIYVLKNM